MVFSSQEPKYTTNKPQALNTSAPLIISLIYSYSEMSVNATGYSNDNVVAYCCFDLLQQWV